MRFRVAVSGVAQIASGAACSGRPPRAGAWTAAATLIGVFAGNDKMALDAGPPGSAWSTVLWLRLALQIPLVLWVLRCAQPASPGGLG